MPEPAFEKPTVPLAVKLLPLAIVVVAVVVLVALFWPGDDADENELMTASAGTSAARAVPAESTTDAITEPTTRPQMPPKTEPAPLSTDAVDPAETTPPADEETSAVVTEDAIFSAADRVKQAAIDRAQDGSLVDPIEVADDPDYANRTPHPAPGPEPLHAGVKEFGNFKYIEGEISSVPDDVMAYDGNQVRIFGYMIPTKQTTEIREFLIVADVAECCFGEPPGLEHLIMVKLPEERSVPFVFGEIEVTGQMNIEEEREAGYVVNLLTIDNVASVKSTGRP